MKKVFQWCGLGLVCALCLSGCSHAPIKPKERTVTLPDSYAAAVQIVYSKTTLQGRMERSSSGEIRFTAEQPENLSGLSLQLEDGVLRAEYADMCVFIHQAATPASAMLTLLKDALGTINGETLQLSERTLSRPLQLQNEHGRLEVLFEEENFLPQKISMPDLDFTAELKALSPEPG